MFKLMANDNFKYPDKSIKAVQKAPELEDIDLYYLQKAQKMVDDETDHKAIQRVAKHFESEWEKVTKE
jgi:hypothetical protein